MKRELILVAGPVLVAVLAAASCGGGRQEAERKPAPKATPPAKITQFYSSTPVVARGEQALLCYGVEEARAVRIEPDVEPIKPAYSRCIQATPRQTTRYTLTAQGEDGKDVTASLTVEVRAGAKAKAAPAAEPAAPAGTLQIAYFRVEQKGGTLLCYQVAGAEAVAIEPGVLPRSGAMQGCLGVAPKQPTTYTLRAWGAGGKTVQRTVTVTP